MGTIAQKLTYLESTKTAIGNAITAKGGSVTGKTFREYATEISNLPSGGGDDTFEHYLNNTLTSYTVPASVTSLHNYCFSHLTNLKSINLNNVTSIGSHAFEYTDLSDGDMIVNNNVTVGEDAFYNTNLKKIVFKGNVTFGTTPFHYMSNLTKIIIEGSFSFNGSNAWISEVHRLVSVGDLNSGCDVEVNTSGDLPSQLISSYLFGDVQLNNTTSLGNQSIVGCMKLQKMTLPSTLTAINGYNFTYFYSCVELEFKSVNPPTWQSYKNNTSMPLMDIIVPAASLQSYKTAFPEFSDIIFADNDKPSHQYSEARYWSNNTLSITTSQDTTLTSSTFPSSNRRALYVGKNVTEIGQRFYSNGHIVIPDDNSIETIGDNGIYGIYQKTLNLPNIISIGNSGLSYARCVNIVLGNNLTTIGNLAFSNITADSLTIPDSVTNIGHSIISYSKLKKVTLGSGIALQNDSNTLLGTRYNSDGLLEAVVRFPVIYRNNFYSLNNTVDLVLTENVTTINYMAIYQPHSITCLGTTPPTLANDGIMALGSDTKIYVPAESVETYKSATNWSSFASHIQAIPEE